MARPWWIGQDSARNRPGRAPARNRRTPLGRPYVYREGEGAARAGRQAVAASRDFQSRISVPMLSATRAGDAGVGRFKLNWKDTTASSTSMC